MSLDLDAIEQRANRYLTTRDHVDRAYELHDLTTAAAASAEDVPDLLAEVKRYRDGIKDLVDWADGLREPAVTVMADDLKKLLPPAEAQRCQSCAPGYDCERGIYTTDGPR